MSYIEVCQPDGTYYTTLEKVGTKSEYDYYRVMTESFGKLFFINKESYEKWCEESRIETEKRGGFRSGSCYSKHVEHANDDEFVIIEEYVVEQNGEIA